MGPGNPAGMAIVRGEVAREGKLKAAMRAKIPPTRIAFALSFFSMGSRSPPFFAHHSEVEIKSILCQRRFLFPSFRGLCLRS